MTRPLAPKKIEVAQQTSSRAECRKKKRKQKLDKITANQHSNGVIIIPPPNAMRYQQSDLNCAG